MRRLVFLSLLISFSLPVFSQSDMCLTVNKALAGAAANFNNYTNFQFLTKGGQSAYLSDFSFVPAAPAYVYKDNVKNETYFFQKITDDVSVFNTWYKAFEPCLVNQKEKWTKLDGADGKSVIFSCPATGVKWSLIAGSAGLTVKIYRDKIMNIPVLTANFCELLEKMATSCAGGFASIMGAYRDSGILGKSYKSTIQLNQRGLPPTIYVGKDIFHQNKPKYSMNEMFAEYEVPYVDLLAKIEQCLSEAKGWKKQKRSYGEGFEFIKGEVSVSIKKDSGSDPASFIDIGTYTKY